MRHDSALANNEQKQELHDFTAAIEEKIAYARKHNKCCLIAVLHKVKNDMQKWITAYEEGSKSFDETYQDITYLYIFTESYVISHVHP